MTGFVFPCAALAALASIAVIILSIRRSARRRREADRDHQALAGVPEWSHPIPAPRSADGGEGDFEGRVLAAFLAGRDAYGWRTIADMRRHGLVQLVEAVERGFPSRDAPPPEDQSVTVKTALPVSPARSRR